MNLQFSDHSLEGADVVSYDAKEHEQKYVRDCLIQTEPRVFASRATQIIRRKEIQIQTNDDSRDLDPDLVPLNHPSMLKFLSSVEDSMFEALEDNLTSYHFAGYEVDWSEDQESEVNCVNTFYASESLLNTHLSSSQSNANTDESNTESSQFYQSKTSHGDEDDLSTSSAVMFDNSIVSSISWNCQGSLFAASLANTEHEDWCVHKSAIVLWNIGRTKVDAKKPHNTIECSGCVTDICFHPSNPALLGAGSFNGEVFVLDLSRDESSQLVASVASLHTEPICTVHWIRDPESNTLHAPYMLVTSGQDGKILMCSLNEISRQLTLVSGQVLLSESMSRSSSSRSAISDAVLGVSVMCSFSLDPTSFVLGSETGGVFKCSFNHTPNSRIVHSITQQDVQFSSAAQLGLESHLGPVTWISASPFHWKIILTASADCTIRLYNTLQVEACLVIRTSEPISCLDWSPVRPMVFAAVTTHNHLLLFDLLSSRSSPTHQVSMHPKARTATSNFGSVVKFNPKRPDLAITGDSLGQIKLWSIPHLLTKTSESNELELLEKICSIDNSIH